MKKGQSSFEEGFRTVLILVLIVAIFIVAGFALYKVLQIVRPTA